MNRIINALCWAVFTLLPVKKNKIVATSYYGKGYSDSPKAIVDSLLKKRKDLDIVWLTDKNTELPQGVRLAKYNSYARAYHLSTAKVWIDNCRKGAPHKKRSQIYMQTWHGFALKRIEKDVVDKLPDSNYEKYAIRDSSQTDVIVSNSKHMSKIYSDSFWYDGSLFEVGSPRNDVFFSDNDSCTKVHKALSIPDDAKIVLYAPTFRVSQSLEPYDIDDNKLCQALTERFGSKWSFVTRLHPNVAKYSHQLHYSNSIDATGYDDIQELLCAADLLITDYSSVMFDYMLSGKPCFVYATDIEEYRNDRNFYIPINTLPFPIATDMNSFVKNIIEFNTETYKENIDAFYKNYGIMEKGNAADLCADWILNKIDL